MASAEREGQAGSEVALGKVVHLTDSQVALFNQNPKPKPTRIVALDISWDDASHQPEALLASG